MAAPRVRQVRDRRRRSGLRQHLVRLAHRAGDHRHAAARPDLPDRPPARACRPSGRCSASCSRPPTFWASCSRASPPSTSSSPSGRCSASTWPCATCRPATACAGCCSAAWPAASPWAPSGRAASPCAAALAIIAALPAPRRGGARSGGPRSQALRDAVLPARGARRAARRALLRELHRLLHQGPPHAVAVVGPPARRCGGSTRTCTPPTPMRRGPTPGSSTTAPSGTTTRGRTAPCTASSRSATRCCGGPRCRRWSASSCWPSCRRDRELVLLPLIVALLYLPWLQHDAHLVHVLHDAGGAVHGPGRRHGPARAVGGAPAALAVGGALLRGPPPRSSPCCGTRSVRPRPGCSGATRPACRVDFACVVLAVAIRGRRCSLLLAALRCGRGPARLWPYSHLGLRRRGHRRLPGLPADPHRPEHLDGALLPPHVVPQLDLMPAAAPARRCDRHERDRRARAGRRRAVGRRAPGRSRRLPHARLRRALLRARRQLIVHGRIGPRPPSPWKPGDEPLAGPPAARHALDRRRHRSPSATTPGAGACRRRSPAPC